MEERVKFIARLLDGELIVAGNLSNALGGISRNDTEASGVTEQVFGAYNGLTLSALGRVVSGNLWNLMFIID